MKIFLEQKMWLLLVPLLFLQGCDNRYEEKVQQQHAAVTKQLDSLKDKLDNNNLSNAVLVKSYGATLSTLKPELIPVIDTLKKDASSQGGMYKNLESRLKAVNKKPERQADYRAASEDLNNITVGADAAVFNDSLLDIVNTLADLSGGKLARINVPKSKVAENLKDKQGIVPGSYLVGNPNYGSFKQDDSGKSMWEWYGQYAMFRDLMGAGANNSYRRGPIYANDWYREPHNSYYNNYGRDSYGSRQAKKKWKTRSTKLRANGIVPPKPKKDFRSIAGKKRLSSYAYQKASYTQHGAKTKSVPRNTTNNTKTQRVSSFNSFRPSSRGSSTGGRSFRSGK